MPETRAAKKIFKWNPLTTRSRGRPRYRWENSIIQDVGLVQDWSNEGEKLDNLCPG